MSAPAISRVSRFVSPAIPRLRLVVAPVRRRRVPFALTCIAILAAGLVAVLLVNINLSHSSYRISHLTSKQQQLEDQKQELSEDLSYRKSPQNLSAEAGKLGMVPQRAPVFLMLDDGRVVNGKTKQVLPKSATTRIPGPEANSRNAVRPNLRQGTTQEPIGGVKAHPKNDKIGSASQHHATRQQPMHAPAQRTPTDNHR